MRPPFRLKLADNLHKSRTVTPSCSLLKILYVLYIARLRLTTTQSQRWMRWDFSSLDWRPISPLSLNAPRSLTSPSDQPDDAFRPPHSQLAALLLNGILLVLRCDVIRWYRKKMQGHDRREVSVCAAARILKVGAIFHQIAPRTSFSFLRVLVHFP